MPKKGSVKIRLKIIKDGDLTAQLTKGRKEYSCGACQGSIAVSEMHYCVHCRGESRNLDSRIHATCIGKVIKVPKNKPAKPPEVEVATNCGVCGTELSRLTWNQDCDIKICLNTKCELYRHPQAKVLKERDDRW